MPLPEDFKMSTSTFAERGKVLDYSENTDTMLTYKDGKTYPKTEGRTYVDITIQVLTGKNANEKFIQPHVDTAIYQTKAGKKSAMYVWLEMLGLDKGVLQNLANQHRPTINLMDTIGKEFVGVLQGRDGQLYINLKDVEHANKTTTKQSADIGDDLDTELEAALQDNTSIFDE